MPIDKEEFENGKLHSKVEEEITTFLKERPKRAFTSQEIMEGIRYYTDFGTPEIAKMSTFAVAAFTAFLQHLVDLSKIKMKVVRGRMYFIDVRYRARCPKCGVEVTEPRKTWKMAGRPDREGKRLQLHIGLFDCSKHGSFRKVIGKEKIPAQTIPSKKVSRRKKRVTKKKATKKKAPKRLTKKRVTKKKRNKRWIVA